MHHAVAMRVLQRAPHLLHDTEDLGQRQRAAFHDDLLEGAPADPLHRVPEERARRTHTEDRDDVRVVEGRGDLRFALEPLRRSRSLEELQREDLDCHLAIEVHFLGQVDKRHPAATEQVGDLVLAAQLAPQGVLELLRDRVLRSGVRPVLLVAERHAALGASGRAVGDAVGAAARADHGLGHMEISGAFGVLAERHPGAAPARLVAGVCPPVIASREERDRVRRVGGGSVGRRDTSSRV